MKIKLSSRFPTNIIQGLLIHVKYRDKKAPKSEEVKSLLKNSSFIFEQIQLEKQYPLNVRNDTTLDTLAKQYQAKIEISVENRSQKETFRSYGEEEWPVVSFTEANGETYILLGNNYYTPRGLLLEGQKITRLDSIVRILDIPIVINGKEHTKVNIQPCPLVNGDFKLIERELFIQVNIWEKSFKFKKHFWKSVRIGNTDLVDKKIDLHRNVCYKMYL